MALETVGFHRFGDHVNTDVILPGKYLSLKTASELAPYCFEGLDPTFAQRVRPSDVIVAGRNFGAGSSREHAPLAIKGCGVQAIIAASFARIFYRNALNIGLPVIICRDLVDALDDNAVLQLDIQAGHALVAERLFEFDIYPPMIRRIVDADGLIPYVKRVLREQE